MHTETDAGEFRRSLLRWFEKYQRDLPWRRTKDPYAIWISEAMLQQTRVSAVLPYYERFLARFPNFHALAAADEADVLAQWAGLGYYYRARNLQKAARSMAEAGAYPTDYEAIRLLPGVGEYTAAAVASIAFDLPHAVLDGNVFRVLSRVFADTTDISSGKSRRHFAVLADSLLDRERPGTFNQAMMELGATVCLVRNPQCLLCPVSEFCAAKRSATQHQFPVNRSKQISIKRTRTLFWIEQDNAVLAWERPPTSRLMPGFWELPERDQLPTAEAGVIIGAFRHCITVHNYTFSVARCQPPHDLGPCHWLPLESAQSRPLSTVFKKAVKCLDRAARPAGAAGS